MTINAKKKKTKKKHNKFQPINYVEYLEHNSNGVDDEINQILVDCTLEDVYTYTGRSSNNQQKSFR